MYTYTLAPERRGQTIGRMSRFTPSGAKLWRVKSLFFNIHTLKLAPEWKTISCLSPIHAFRSQVVESKKYRIFTLWLQKAEQTLLFRILLVEIHTCASRTAMPALSCIYPFVHCLRKSPRDQHITGLFCFWRTSPATGWGWSSHLWTEEGAASG